jgi:hypothetical protein
MDQKAVLNTGITPMDPNLVEDIRVERGDIMHKTNLSEKWDKSQRIYTERGEKGTRKKWYPENNGKLSLSRFGQRNLPAPMEEDFGYITSGDLEGDYEDDINIYGDNMQSRGFSSEVKKRGDVRVGATTRGPLKQDYKTRRFSTPSLLK